MGVRSVLYRFRSSITGRFVKKGTASRHPRETVSERIEPYMTIDGRRVDEAKADPRRQAFSDAAREYHEKAGE